MDRVLIPKAENIRVRFAEPKPAWGRDADGLLWLRCKCGHLMTLQHSIDEKGDINPSLHHDQDFCGWHVHATLSDWDGVAEDYS